MKYFIFYVTYHSHHTSESHVKGKSMDYILERIERYSDGCIVTSREGICTDQAKSLFVREINLKDFPSLSKRDFAMINETKSYNHSDFL